MLGLKKLNVEAEHSGVTKDKENEDAGHSV